MEKMIYSGIVFVAVILPILLIALDILFYVKKKEKPIFEGVAFGIGGIYMFLAFVLWDLPDYDMALNVYGTANAHTPFNIEYWPAILLFVFWSFTSYMCLKFGRRKNSPIMEVFMLAGMYIGIFWCLMLFVQLLCGAHPQPADMKELFGSADTGELYYFRPEGFDVLIILSLMVVPGLFMIHAIHLMIRLVKEKAQKQEMVQYSNGFLRMCNLWLLKGGNQYWVAVLAMLPVLGILVMFLVLFGQQPDSIIKVFTQTSDWILSEQISPPPVAYDTHYLCTVSLRGHKRIVKPTRYGIRRGEKIVVNRQLCVANAFEHYLEEKTPNLHKKIRRFYDTYGYPISKHIRTALAADIVYILMKPLEWFFVFFLYLFDEDPETRINSQYMPKEWRLKLKAKS